MKIEWKNLEEYQKEEISYLCNEGWRCIKAPSSYLVHQGMYDDVNVEYCNEHNIPIVKMERLGGSIVESPNSYGMIITQPNYKLRTKIERYSYPIVFQKLIDYIKSRGIDCVVDNNDLLIDGKKACSYARTVMGNFTCDTIHIGMNVNLELINAICKKPMSKIPVGLNDYGITSEDIDLLLESIEI